MKKTLHRFIVKGTDDARIDMMRTRWMSLGIYRSRREAWAEARRALGERGFRHVKVVEERQYKGAD